ncbi:M13 family metallopeptidase [Microbacter margulisiae]|uniref:Putative endopeptidase n=1 Tax=Microbacter margulisiae TaxID=1350067 RepID=A0A7W5DQ53_9PORP|nr:M13 family metallopeptidase [Microbacter margulisiae]MBB3187030.1 putative endopeptidase [Microbacter margulisiae]
MNKFIPFKRLLIIALVLLLSSATLPLTAQTLDPLVAHIDSTVNPGDNFFMFANGRWFKDHPIPPSEQSNGIFQTIQDTINAQIHDVCVSSSTHKNEVKGSARQKIGDFYYTGMDSVALNKNGISPLKLYFLRIDRIQNRKELMQAVAFLQTVAASPMFSFYVGPDDKISSKNAIHLSQGGLSLPDRDYYFATDKQAVEVRKQFVLYLQKQFRNMGYAPARANLAAEQVMKLETALAKISRERADTRDPLKNYSKMSFAQLEHLAPHLDFAAFFQAVGLPPVDSVIVGQSEFLTAENNMMSTISLAVWKDYLKFQLLNNLSDYLNDVTYRLSFDFYARTLRGIQEPRPRWKRVTNETNSALGDLVGQVYVTDYLPKGTKAKLYEIGHRIKEIYAERIKHLDWMTPDTKTKALHKLDVMIMKVGYPDKWKDMSALQIDRSSYVNNVIRANEWAMHYMIAKYGKPVDRTEWDMEPQTYNAYYNPSNNEIVVPGCNILVPGYEHKMADDAILYSIIGGSTFGHEMTHGFDDQGSKYDAEGNLHNWWTPEDSTRFYAKTRMLAKQFDKYVVVDSLHVNGAMTLGENIADLGGITMGYQAFQQTNQYKSNEKIAGLTPDQRFFLGYAMAWMVHMRPQALANQVRSDVHSPAKYRVNGPLSDLDAFYKTFHVHKGDAMWLPDSLRVKIW